MAITKLINDIDQASRGTELSEITDCVITLLVTRKKIQTIFNEKGRQNLGTDYITAVNDLAVASAALVLGDKRPTVEEMKKILAL